MGWVPFQPTFIGRSTGLFLHLNVRYWLPEILLVAMHSLEWLSELTCAWHALGPQALIAMEAAGVVVAVGGEANAAVGVFGIVDGEWSWGKQAVTALLADLHHQ